MLEQAPQSVCLGYHNVYLSYHELLPKNDETNRVV